MENEWINDPQSPYWLLIIYALCEDAKQNNETKWEEYLSEITFSNRFFPKNNAVFMEIDQQAKSAETVIPAQSLLYRARIYKDPPNKNLMDYLREELGYSEEKWQKEKTKFSEHNIEYQLKLFLASYNGIDMPKGNDKESLALTRAVKRWRSSKFKGYNKKDSMPPPPDKTPAGRANPNYISYTYLSEDQNTPIYEVRPTIGQNVGVAKFKLIKDIRVYDISKPIVGNRPEDIFPKLFTLISEKFSLPYNGNEIEYLPTQYLAEYIKHLGFDGIRYNSSLNKGGKNIVLFSKDCYEIISSQLYQISNMELKFGEPKILPIEE